MAVTSRPDRIRIGGRPDQPGNGFTCQPSLPWEQIDSLHELDFVRRKENAVCLGSPGVGKTYLAIGLAIRATQDGRTVYYVSLRDLVESLEAAERKGQLRRRLGILTYPVLLVVDDIGCADRRCYMFLPEDGLPLHVTGQPAPPALHVSLGARLLRHVAIEPNRAERQTIQRFATSTRYARRSA